MRALMRPTALPPWGSNGLGGMVSSPTQLPARRTSRACSVLGSGICIAGVLPVWNGQHRRLFDRRQNDGAADAAAAAQARQDGRDHVAQVRQRLTAHFEQVVEVATGLMTLLDEIQFA